MHLALLQAGSCEIPDAHAIRSLMIIARKKLVTH
jgi:hypothetical protein